MDQSAFPIGPQDDGAADGLPAPATPQVLWTRPRLALPSSLFSVPVPKALVPPSPVAVQCAKPLFVPLVVSVYLVRVLCALHFHLWRVVPLLPRLLLHPGAVVRDLWASVLFIILNFIRVAFIFIGLW